MGTSFKMFTDTTLTNAYRRASLFFLFLFFLLFIDEERTNKFMPREAQIRSKKQYFCCIVHSDRTDIRSLRMKTCAHCVRFRANVCVCCVSTLSFSAENPELAKVPPLSLRLE